MWLKFDNIFCFGFSMKIVNFVPEVLKFFGDFEGATVAQADAKRVDSFGSGS